MLGYFRLLLALGVVASHTVGYYFQRYPDTGIVAVVTFFFVLVAPIILIASGLVTDRRGRVGLWDRISDDMAYPVFIFYLPLMIFIGFPELNFWTAFGLNSVAALIMAWLVHWCIGVRLKDCVTATKNRRFP